MADQTINDFMAEATMSKSFQSAFNVVKGSVPARTDVPDTDFDVCGKKGIADLKAANDGGTLSRLAGPGLRRASGGRQCLQGRRHQVRPWPDQDLG